MAEVVGEVVLLAGTVVANEDVVVVHALSLTQ